MEASDVVILVPGFFGFGTFGRADQPHISYFERVAAILAETTGWSPHQFRALQPPPTGPLWSRVACLHQEVVALSERFRRVHLVGHSTGGLDARLLANEKYLWPGGPLDRRTLIDRLGHIITVSAPFRGTPFADRLPIGLEITVPAATALSIATTPSVIRGPTQFWNAFSALLPDGWIPKSADAPETAALANPEVWPYIHRFLRQVLEDRRLIGDLSTRAMRQLNERIEGGDRHPIESFVTVAPRPGLLPTLNPGRNTLRYLYATSYWFTHPGTDSELDTGLGRIRTPSGARMIASPQAAQPPGSSDGVVPVASQTLDNFAEGIVLADHLDVIGHYPSGGGITFFDSEAHFRDGELQQFWQRVGELLMSAIPASA